MHQRNSTVFKFNLNLIPIWVINLFFSNSWHAFISSANQGGRGGDRDNRNFGGHNNYNGGAGGYSSSGSRYGGGSRGGYSNNNYYSGGGGNNSGEKIELDVKKDFYQEDPIISAASTEQVAEFRAKNNNIMVFPPNETVKVPNPVITFAQAFVCDKLILDAIKSQNFQQPSPIQCQVWPIILSGHDCISISQTGSGISH